MSGDVIVSRQNEKKCKWYTCEVRTHLGTKFVYLDCNGNPKEHLTIYCSHCGGRVELEKEQ